MIKKTLSSGPSHLIRINRAGAVAVTNTLHYALLGLLTLILFAYCAWVGLRPLVDEVMRTEQLMGYYIAAERSGQPTQPFSDPGYDYTQDSAAP